MNNVERAQQTYKHSLPQYYDDFHIDIHEFFGPGNKVVGDWN